MKSIKITKIYAAGAKKKKAYPLFISRISAGFPSPADDYIEKKLDLNEHLIKNPAATFFLKVEGESMLDAGIHSGDILIVDRAVHPASGNIVIARLNGELTVKRLRKEKGDIFLEPANARYKPMKIDESVEFEIWGVVKHVIHSL